LKQNSKEKNGNFKTYYGDAVANKGV